MILGTALVILGVVFLIVALYTLLVKIPKSRAQVERRTGKTTGRVTEIHVKTYRRKKPNKIGYYETKTYKADFSYNVGGTEYFIKGIPVTPAPEEGEEVEISYNPDDPADAHADKYFANPYSNKVGGLILLVLSAVLLILGVICFLAS
jgi:hypothetical protein